MKYHHDVEALERQTSALKNKMKDDLKNLSPELALPLELSVVGLEKTLAVLAGVSAMVESYNRKAAENCNYTEETYQYERGLE